jgi:hypothetical protein
MESNFHYLREKTQSLASGSGQNLLETCREKSQVLDSCRLTASAQRDGQECVWVLEIVMGFVNKSELGDTVLHCGFNKQHKYDKISCNSVFSVAEYEKGGCFVCIA